VLVAPFACDVNKIHTLIDAHRPKGLKVFLVVGHRDCHCLEVARQLVDLLPRHGVMCQLIEYQDLEHKFPVDFEKKLPEALDFVSQTW
jgi:acetyl esterase/lipase